MTFARLEIFPDGVRQGQVEFADRNADLADRIVATESVVVEYLEVQRPVLKLALRETYNGQIEITLKYLCK